MTRRRCPDCARFRGDTHDCVKNDATCTVDGCPRPQRARGWCTRHYQRWQKHGDPTRVLTRDERKPRSDTAGHGTRRRYRHGCRCLPCAVEESRYQAAWKNGQRRRVPAEQVVEHLDRLNAAGWTDADLTRELGLSSSTLWSIRNVNRQVNSRTAHAILSLQPPADLSAVVLPAGPLVDALERAARGADEGVRAFLGGADAKAFYRARTRGIVTADTADRLATKHLGTPLELLYGPTWDQLDEGAAA